MAEKIAEAPKYHQILFTTSDGDTYEVKKTEDITELHAQFLAEAIFTAGNLRRIVWNYDSKIVRVIEIGTDFESMVETLLTGSVYAYKPEKKEGEGEDGHS